MSDAQNLGSQASSPRRSLNHHLFISGNAATLPSSNGKSFHPAQVPTDVWLNVVRCGLERERKPHRNDYIPLRQTLPLPLRMSHVCSHLRHVALNIPSLWTTLDSSVLRSPGMLDAFLSRSHRCLLYIEIADDYVSMGRFGQLVVHIDRWKTFIVSADSAWPELSKIIEHLPTLHAPQLTCLSLRSTYWITCSQPIFANGTPMLTTLTLSNLSTVPHSLGTLTELSLGNGYLGASTLSKGLVLADVLVCMPVLARLRLKGPMTWRIEESLVTINLPALENLYITPPDSYQRPRPYLSDFFATIKAPSLHLLALGPLTSTPEFPPFTTRLRNGAFMFPNVKLLCWTTPLDTNEDMLAFSKAFPALETLSILTYRSNEIFNQLLAFHTHASAQAPPWPNLCNLNLQHISVTLIRSFASSRIRIGLPIMKVQLMQTRPGTVFLDVTDLDWLQKNIELAYIPENDLVLEGTGWETWE